MFTQDRVRVGLCDADWSAPYLTNSLINKAIEQMAEDDQLSITLKALADPTRREILRRLAQGEATVTELAEPFDISLPAISRHLKVLEQAGLIRRGRDAQWRPCRLEAGPLKEVAAWVTHYQVFWEERFDRLEDHVRAMQKGSHQ